MNHFLALMNPLPFLFLSIVSITEEVASVAHLGKTSLAKGTPRSNNNFCQNHLFYPPEWTILATWHILSFIPVDILLVKTFLILVFHLAIKNNSWGNSSTWQFFLAILMLFQYYFFATDFYLFSCVFLSLTLALG